jgi:hypothetical protein
MPTILDLRLPKLIFVTAWFMLPLLNLGKLSLLGLPAESRLAPLSLGFLPNLVTVELFSRLPHFYVLLQPLVQKCVAK